MALYDLLKSAQEKNEEDQLSLIRQFTPLLRKYAYKLNVEDAYEMLLLDFFRLLMTMDVENMHDKTDAAFAK